VSVKRVPASACRLRCGSVDLLARDVEHAQADSPPQASILARSGQAVPHWYWGNLVNDLAGMQQINERLPLDYCHDQGEILGYAEQWSKDSGDLTCVGTLLTEQSERAAEVVNLSRSGVPYQASISFMPLAIEELKAGQSAQINGRLVEGPAAVIRRWQLTGLAVCPRGADPNTRTALSAEGGEFEVEFIHKEQPMPEKSEAKTTDQLKAELRAAHAEFSAKHGAELAAKFGPLGECELSIEHVAAHLASVRTGHAAELTAAKTAHEAVIAEMQGKLTAAESQVTELQARLTAIGPLGERDPASSAPAEGDSPQAKRAAELSANASPGVAKFAASMKLQRPAA
jgi:hypothetical protein